MNTASPTPPRIFYGWWIVATVMLSQGLNIGLPSYVFGFALGGLLPLWGALIGECYGSESFGQVMGLQSPLLLPPNILGALFVAWCFDSMSSYDLACNTYLKISAVVVVLVLLLRLPHRHSPQQNFIPPANAVGHHTIQRT